MDVLEARVRTDGRLVRADHRQHGRARGPRHTVGVLEHDVVEDVVGEVERGPEEAQLGELAQRGHRRRRPDRPHAPRAVLAAPDREVVERQRVAGRPDRAGPRPELRRPRDVELQAHVRVAGLTRLLVGGRPGVERQLRLEAVLGCVDRQLRRPHRLDDVHRHRADRRDGAVVRRPARREHRALDAVVDDAERSVDHAAVRVAAHRQGEEHVLRVAVEPEPVVEVGVPVAGLGERHGRLVDRVVVEPGQHRGSLAETTFGPGTGRHYVAAS